MLYDRGLVSCYDANTGRLLYDRERLPNGFAFTASPWAAAGRIFCLNEDGVCYVLRAGDTFELLHTNTLADDDMCMATAALAGDWGGRQRQSVPHGGPWHWNRPVPFT